MVMIEMEFNYLPNNSTRVLYNITDADDMSFLAQLVERVTSNDEVSRSSRLEGINFKADDLFCPVKTQERFNV